MKNKNFKKIIIGLIALIVVIVAVIIIVNLSKKDKKSDINDILESESFFMEDKKGNYALFNEDGKQLTEFIFDDVDTNIVNGATKVKNSDGKYGILSENGKMIADFGTYTYISHTGALFNVTGKENKSYLLNASGKEVGSKEIFGSSFYVFSSGDLYVIVATDKEYNVLNYNGKSILTFENVLGAGAPRVSGLGRYVLISYNKNNYIINLLNGELLLSFEDEQEYCVSDTNENSDGDLILETCKRSSSNEYTYKVVKDRKIIYETTNKLKYDDGYNVIKFTSDGKFLLDEKGNEKFQIWDIAYNDYDSYAKYTDGSFNGVDIYDKGVIVKHIDCRRIDKTDYMSEGIYILDTYHSRSCGTTSGTYEYYKADGTLLNGEQYSIAEKFDENHLARVSKDKKSYYLINTKGEKVTSDYNSIDVNNGEYYIATKKDSTKVIINTKGEELISGDSIEFRTNSDKNFALIEKDNKYIVYNLDDKKEIITLESEPNLKEHYIQTSQDGKKQYYSYNNGKMFYES